MGDDVTLESVFVLVRDFDWNWLWLLAAIPVLYALGVLAGVRGRIKQREREARERKERLARVQSRALFCFPYRRGGLASRNGRAVAGDHL